MNAKTAHWPSRIGSWLVLALGLVLVVFVIGTWTDALGRFFAPDIAADPALANEATLAPDAFSGIGLVSAGIGTIPLAAGLWGLWHLYKILGERGLGRKVDLARRLRHIGVALMGMAVLVAGLAYVYAVSNGQAAFNPVLPSHIAIFGVGFLVLLLSLWQQRRGDVA